MTIFLNINSESEHPAVLERILLINCREIERTKVLSDDRIKAITLPNGRKIERKDIDPPTLIKVNSYKFFNLSFFESNLGCNLELQLQIQFRSNPFISDPVGKMTIAMTPNLEKLMVSSDILDPQAELKFKVTSHRGDIKTVKNRNKNYYLCGTTKKQDPPNKINKVMEFTTFDVRDNLIIQILSNH